ncbi:MAG TPA: NPCBM/NEW2 domain-containing protein, partial [Pirellulales bacterium]|nr:NPCBM/NEW2 domain-containing protein [Pirellulales bacterium]
GDFFHYHRDIGFDQSPLRLNGQTYRKGLALQSRTALSYKLPGKFRALKAVMGIDDSVRDAGSVRVEIKGDGKVLWQGDVRGTEPARELELNLSGVRRLDILADFGEDLDIGDRLDLCDARVTK